MWLLDANISHKVKAILVRAGIECATAHEKGWEELRNGELVQQAVDSGFTCILTQDVRFIESAARTLQRHKKFCIVLIRLRQQKGRTYANLFRDLFKKKPIVPRTGRLTEWP